MDYHNQRFPLMKMLIDDSIDFANKTVIDLGCGYGDLCFHAAERGARYVIGVDKDPAIIEAVEHRSSKLRIYEEFTIILKDLDSFWLANHYDYAFCMSVLPYLVFPDKLLVWMAQHADVAIIECQYKGDGPGQVLDFDHMKAWLEEYWDFVQCLGGTLVKDRQKIRHIWMCKNDA